MQQIRAAGADIRTEHIGAVAFVMHAAGDEGAMVRQFGDIAEQIDRGAADRRQEHMKVGPRHQFGKHAGGLLEQLPAQVVFGGGEARGKSRQIPHRVDRDLDDGDASARLNDFAVMLQPAGCERGLQFRQIEARAGDGDARADIDALGDLLGEFFRGEYWSGQDAGSDRARPTTPPARDRSNRSRCGCRSRYGPADAKPCR